MASKKGRLSGLFSVQGKPNRRLDLPGSSTFRGALVAAGVDPETAQATLNGEEADLGTRLKANFYIAVMPNVKGGSR